MVQIHEARREGRVSCHGLDVGDDVVRRSQVAWIDGCPVVPNLFDNLGIRVESDRNIIITSRDGNRERLVLEIVRNIEVDLRHIGGLPDGIQLGLQLS